jgi:hypothetical protein
MPPISIVGQRHLAPAAVVVKIAQFGYLGWGAAIALAVLGAASLPYQFPPVTHYYFVIQDTPVLLFMAAFFVLVHVLPGRFAATPTWLEARYAVPTMRIVTIAVCVTIYAGARLAYQDYALSVDEFMAVFDSQIIAAGKLLAPVAPEWRDLVPGLQPIFRLPVPDDAYWVSSYLPMNAVLRAGFLWLGSPALAGVALAAVSLLALFGIARRLWPDRPDAAIVGVALLASSSQFLITAMTPYAMTAHLALNLVWLWLFLRGTWPSHVLAAAVAFVACGLHQVAFHPLFAAPFLASLVLTRRWRLVFFYGGAYGAIILFWILYWKILLLGVGSAPVDQSADVGMAYFVQRVTEMVEVDTARYVLMGMNLLRFIAWQAPLLVPLALVGALVCRGRSAVTVHLALGIMLTVAAMLVLTPHQGHGWGYRYLHGLLGSFALLAAQGWIWLTDRLVPMRKQLAFGLLLSTALSVSVLLPWRLAQVYAFVRPYAAAHAVIAGANADVVIVDARNVWHGVDLVRNDPFLRASPKVIDLASLQEQQLVRLCGRYRLEVFDEEDASRLGMRLAPGMKPAAATRADRLRQVMHALGCDARHVGRGAAGRS